MANTTVAITHTVIAPGTSFSIDVTNANLDDSDNVFDFDIYHDGTHQPTRAGYTKSSNGTSVDYSGSSLTGVVVEVRRHSSPADVLFFENPNYLVALRLDEMLDRCWKHVEELETFVTNVNDVVISDTAYGASWNGDGNAASKNALYDQIELQATLASPTFTGTVTVPATVTDGEQIASKSYADATASTLIAATGLKAESEPDDDDDDTTIVSAQWLTNTFQHVHRIENESGQISTGAATWQSINNVFDTTAEAGTNGGLWLWGDNPYYDPDLDRTTDDTNLRTVDETYIEFVKLDDGSDQIAVGDANERQLAWMVFLEYASGTQTLDVEFIADTAYVDQVFQHGVSLFRIR